MTPNLIFCIVFYASSLVADLVYYLINRKDEVAVDTVKTMPIFLLVWTIIIFIAGIFYQKEYLNCLSQYKSNYTLIASAIGVLYGYFITIWGLYYNTWLRKEGYVI